MYDIMRRVSHMFDSRGSQEGLALGRLDHILEVHQRLVAALASSAFTLDIM